MGRIKWVRRMGCLAIACLGVLLIGPAGCATAATVYIDPTAEVNGDGSQASPLDGWDRVKWAAGNTYLQKAGTTWTRSIRIEATGTPKAWIDLGSYGDGPKPRLATHEKSALVVRDVSYRRVRGFAITTTGEDRYWNTTGIYGHNGEHNVFEDLTIGPAAAHGVYLQDKNHVVFRRCEFFNAGTKKQWDSCDNIHLENCHDYLVEFCKSYDCLQGAEYDASDGGDGYTSGTWQYNIAFDKDVKPGTGWSCYKMSGHHPKSSVKLLYNVACGSVRGPGLALQEQLTATAIGNTVYDCDYGIQQCHDRNVIVNNIVVNSDPALQVIKRVLPARCDHNLWFGFQTLVSMDYDGQAIKSLAEWRRVGGGRLGVGSVVADPLFIAPERGNLRIGPGSPAVGSGSVLGKAHRRLLDPNSVWPDRVKLVEQGVEGGSWTIGAFAGEK